MFVLPHSLNRTERLHTASITLAVIFTFNARLLTLALTSQMILSVVTFGMARLEVGRSVFLEYREILEEEQTGASGDTCRPRNPSCIPLAPFYEEATTVEMILLR